VNLRAEEVFEMGFEKVCGLEKAFLSSIFLLETIWQNSWNAGRQ
jgi:hypothetical protein